MKKVLVTAVLAASTALPSPISTANAQTTSSISSTTSYHTVTVDGLKIFYREAGPKDAPMILLLHGYPSSSRMFATLIPLLADHYHSSHLIIQNSARATRRRPLQPPNR